MCNSCNIAYKEFLKANMSLWTIYLDAQSSYWKSYTNGQISIDEYGRARKPYIDVYFKALSHHSLSLHLAEKNCKDHV